MLCCLYARNTAKCVFIKWYSMANLARTGFLTFKLEQFKLRCDVIPSSDFQLGMQQHFSCSYWPLEFPFIMHLQRNWWGTISTKSSFWARMCLKVGVKLEASAVWVSLLKWLSSTVTVFTVHNSVFVSGWTVFSCSAAVEGSWQIDGIWH